MSFYPELLGFVLLFFSWEHILHGVLLHPSQLFLSPAVSAVLVWSGLVCLLGIFSI